MTDDVLGQVLQVLARLGQVGFDLLHLLAMLVDVEQRNAADAHLQQALDVGVRQLANISLRNGLNPSCTAAMTASLVLHCSIFL